MEWAQESLGNGAVRINKLNGPNARAGQDLKKTENHASDSEHEERRNEYNVDRVEDESSGFNVPANLFANVRWQETADCDCGEQA